MVALFRYIHAAEGFPVKSTWIKSIKHGKYNSWPGLTYNNAEKYCPQSVETIKGHMVNSSQGVRSNRKDKYMIRAYNSIMQKFVYEVHHVDIQKLDNEFSTEFKKIIMKDWGATYQLVPPNVHRRNIAERAIRIFKSHFL